MPTKAKAKAAAKPVAKKEERGPLDPKQVAKFFQDPKDFIQFLKRLPPHKTIVHPEVAKQDPSEPILAHLASIWTAQTWYFRDCLGYDRYNDPDTAAGRLCLHYYGENLKQEQRIDIPAGWMFSIAGNLSQQDMRSISASMLAMVAEEVVAAF